MGAMHLEFLVFTFVTNPKPRIPKLTIKGLNLALKNFPLFIDLGTADTETVSYEGRL